VQIKQVVTRCSAGGRSVNEDAVMALGDVPLLAVADGMGGQGAGDEAARIAFDCLRIYASFLASESRHVTTQRTSRGRFNINLLLEIAFKWAHIEVNRAARALQRRRMATALLSIVIAGDHAYISHVGNCRAYVLRGGQLHLLTQDHTVAAARRSFQHAADSDPSEERRLLQILGSGNIDVDLAEVPLADDDVLLLCTDGLSCALSEEKIRTLMTGDDLDAVGDALLAAAEELGKDNIAIAIAQIGSDKDSSSVNEIAELMRSVFLFSDLNTAERYMLAPFLEERLYSAGDALVCEGVMGSEFYVILEGSVKVSRQGVHLTNIGVGGHLGELTLARPIMRSATVTALEAVRVYALSRDRFLQITERRPGLGARLALSLLDTVGTRLRDLTERVAQLEQPLLEPEDTDLIVIEPAESD
jgi:protein phosphatase